jgi:hypothetical protein
MNRSLARSIAAALPLFAAACGSSNAGPQPMMCYSANLIAAEVNNYSFSSTITLPPVTVKAMTNLTFDWSAVTKDFLGHTVNPTTDITLASAMLFQLPLSDVQTKLNDDTLNQDDLVTSVPASWPPPGTPIAGATSAKLYDFQLNGTVITQDMFNKYFDPTMYPSSGNSYMVGVSSGAMLGQGFRMLQTFKLDAASSETTVKLTNSSTQLSYNANLHSLTISGVPGATPALSLDWSQMEDQMKKNALGHTFTAGYITQAAVGHYTQSITELQTQFLNLDSIASEYYVADITTGSVLDFTTLKEKTTSASFPGVSNDGTWLVALFCSPNICRNPAPWYIAILKPCAP